MLFYFPLWNYFLYSSFLIKMIFILLLITSIVSWAFILQSLLSLRTLYKAYSNFEREFWSDIKLTELYEKLPNDIPPQNVNAIFYAGFTEFCRLRNSGCQTLRVILEGVARAMRTARTQALIHVERPLHWLAIIASSSPYWGLLGTLLGIISALNSLEEPTQANALLLIAPGIAEALIISVASLCTAIPAIIFYHSYTHQIDRLFSQYDIFQEEFIALLLRQAYEEQNEKPSSK